VKNILFLGIREAKIAVKVLLHDIASFTME
jgi:hypothetical protein